MAIKAQSPGDYIAWKEWSEHEFGQFGKMDAAYFSAELPIATGVGARIIEIGFGNGAFLGWAQARGAEVYGVELNEILARRAEQYLGIGRAFGSIDAEPLQALRGSFSHVVAFDVLEHIPQQQIPAFLCRVRELLTPDGRCLLRFPNGDSPFGRLIQNGDPTHCTAIGRGKLAFFARQAGLTVLKLRAPVLPTAGIGTARALRRYAVRAARWAIEGVLGTLYFGERIPLAPNYVAVLAPWTA